MDKIKDRTHPKEVFFYVVSRMLERGSYYGFRSLIVLYMISESLKKTTEEALTIYGWLISALIFSQVLGAMLGDLVIGNRKSIILGGIIQTIGMFSFCVPSIFGLYVGLFLVVLGNGLYTPNIISNFGKLYLSKNKLLDSGFTLLYLAVNLGSFFGILLIAFLAKEHGWHVGFMIAGIIMLVSVIPILISKEKKLKETEEKKLLPKRNFLSISVFFLLVGLFWGVYNISNIRFLNLEIELREFSKFGLPKYMWASLKAIIILPVGLLGFILWTYFYNSQFFKLTLGFIFGAISFGVLFMIPEIPNEKHSIIYLISLLFLGISEIHIAPIINSILTKYSNPKYLAILVSLAFIPTRLLSLIFMLFSDKFYENPILGLKFGIITMIAIGFGLAAFGLWKRKNQKIKSFN